MHDFNTHNSTCLQDATTLTAYQSESWRFLLPQRKKPRSPLLKGFRKARWTNQLKAALKLMTDLRISLPNRGVLWLSVYGNLLITLIYFRLIT